MNLQSELSEQNISELRIPGIMEIMVIEIYENREKRSPLNDALKTEILKRQ